MVFPTSLLKHLVLPTALLFGGVAQAQQASFVVSVTLLPAPEGVAFPMSANQLCPEGRPLSRHIASTVRVDCPAGMTDKTATSQNTGAANPGIAFKPSEVVVTF